MIITSFSYKESNWHLDNLNPLGPLNLIVGRNSTGKTRTIRAIQTVSAFLQMKRSPLSPRSFSVELSFSDDLESDDWSMKYSFKVNEGDIVSENLIVCGKSLIKRTKSVAKYDGTTVNPPTDKLIVQVRRDKASFPIIEKLMTWAEGVVCVSCSDINPITTVFANEIYAPIPFYDVVDRLGDENMKNVLSRANEVGYSLTKMSTFKATSDIRLVQVKEKGLSEHLVDIQLSNGMLRTIYLLAFLEYIKHDHRVSMLLVDDLGEGLDYGRSTHLGKMVFDDCRKCGLQLIASSNDAFLMDVVDINDWQVLRRQNSKVSTLNHINSPDLFRKFRLTGLSNFDLFSSDFIEKYLHNQERQE